MMRTKLHANLVRVGLAAWSALAAAVLCSSSALAQDVFRFHDATIVGNDPEWISSIGDVNGDLVEDYAIAGSGIHAAGGLAGVAAFDGATGGLLWFKEHGPLYYVPLDLTGIDDQNSDGSPDLAITFRRSPAPDACIFLDGRTGAEISRIMGAEPDQFERVFGLGDVNGDGFQDFFLLWNEYDLRVYSGAPGHPMLHRLTGLIGFNVMATLVPDADGDGINDIVGVYSNNPRGAVVHSGATGAPIRTILHALTAVGCQDVDGDGLGDVLLCFVEEHIPGRMHNRLSMRSVVDGSEIWGRLGYFPSFINGSFVGGNFLGGNFDPATGGDINGVGYWDILDLDRAPQPGLQRPWMSHRVISGKDGRSLIEVDESDIVTATTCRHGGMNPDLAILGDLDGDGHREFAAVANGYSHCGTLPPVERGLVFIFSGRPGGSVEDVCPAQPNSTGVGATLHDNGAPVIGSRWLMWTLYDAPPQQVAQLMCGPALGPGATPAALGAGDLCFAPQGLVRLGAPEMLGSNGSVIFQADWSGPSITAQWQSGTTWVIQAAFRDTVAGGGANTSNGLLTEFY